MMKKLPTLRKDETVLLIIDMQNDVCKPGGFMDKKGKDISRVAKTIPLIKDLLEFARHKNLFRIFIKNIHADYTTSEVWASRGGGGEVPKMALPDTWGSEIIDELKPGKGEPVVIKHRYSSFINTDLGLILRSKKIKNLIIAGATTEVCIESTARHAFMLDYLTVTVSDCVSTLDPDTHEPSLRILKRHFGHVVTSDQVKEAIE